MKNKDILEKEKEKIIDKMNQAIKDGDAKAFAETFAELCQKIEDNVMEQAREMLNEQDVNILAQRGVRQLTSKERAYYEKVIEAMRADDPKQALNNIDTVMPETVVNSVFEELQTNHPLLSKLTATTVTGLTRIMLNTNGEQKGAWGKLTAKITEELLSGFKEVDVTQDKLSAFLPVSKAMLDLGPEWLDNYIRQVLYEAFANTLEYGIIAGTGKDMPIGMMKQVGDGVTVTGGEYPDKLPIKMTALDVQQMGNVTAIIAKNDKGQSRPVTNLVLIVNPVDYYRRVLPATRMLTPDGVYASVLPVDAEIIPSAWIDEGKAVYGMAGRYFLGVGMSKNGKIEFSDEYRFLEDERVYLIKGYAYGFAMDNNAFQVLDITDLQPVRFRVINENEKVVNSSDLSDLKIGSATLTPKFAKATKTYTAKTSNAKNVITAVPESATATVKITVGDVAVPNGSAATWSQGENTVKVEVTDGEETATYTVTVTKE